MVIDFYLKNDYFMIKLSKFAENHKNMRHMNNSDSILIYNKIKNITIRDNLYKDEHH